MSRRKFLAVSGAIAGTTLVNPKSQILAGNVAGLNQRTGKTKIAVVGTGHRATGMWGDSVLRDYSNYVEYVGLCDKNPGRLETGSQMIGANCPTYTDFEQMMRETKPDQLIITTDDNTHDYFVEKGMEMGANIICEKPMAIDEKKIQTIIDAEKTIPFPHNRQKSAGQAFPLSRRRSSGSAKRTQRQNRPAGFPPQTARGPPVGRRSCASLLVPNQSPRPPTRIYPVRCNNKYSAPPRQFQPSFLPRLPYIPKTAGPLQYRC